MLSCGAKLPTRCRSGRTTAVLRAYIAGVVCRRWTRRGRYLRARTQRREFISILGQRCVSAGAAFQRPRRKILPTLRTQTFKALLRVLTRGCARESSHNRFVFCQGFFHATARLQLRGVQRPTVRTRSKIIGKLLNLRPPKPAQLRRSPLLSLGLDNGEDHTRSHRSQHDQNASNQDGIHWPGSLERFRRHQRLDG